MEANLKEHLGTSTIEQLNAQYCAKRPKRKKASYRPETDIVLWLKGNAPTTFQELVDLRYCLYHRCSRANFKVKRWDKDDLNLTGRSSTLRIVSNQARRFLLTKLRELAKENGWRGALPRCRSPNRHSKAG